MDRHFKTTNRIRGTTVEVEEAARRLRRNMTPAEQKLWEALKGRQVAGLKFRCQHPVGPFVLDFYCPERRLVVELDGGIHEMLENRDQARTAQLADYGYHVIRFRNDEVFDDLDSVLERILHAAEDP